MNKTKSVCEWQDLAVTSVYGEPCGTLAECLLNSDRSICQIATGANGEIIEWEDHFISAPGEAPDWDTPCVIVDWTGFEDALDTAIKTVYGSY